MMTRRLERLLSIGVALLLMHAPLLAQSRGAIHGQVTDARTGAPVSGATVQTSANATLLRTDPEGRFEITGLREGNYLITIQRLGYEPAYQRVILIRPEVATVKFALIAVPVPLTEVITTATGERARLEIGNAIATIKADSIVRYSLIRHMSDLLTARVPGVIVSSTGGAVGAPSKIRLRGVNSIQLNNDPLIILDGIRLTSQTTAAVVQPGLIGSVTNVRLTQVQSSSQLAPSRLDDIDPNTIESIDVLRGPSAASLYGTEGANGVIVIKTKRATPGTLRFTILADQGASAVAGTLPPLWFGWGHRPDGTVINNCFLANGSATAVVPNVTDGTCVQDSVVAFNPENDPQLRTLGTGSARNLGFSMSGGTDRLSQLLSLRLADQVGIPKISAVEERRLDRLWSAGPPSWMRRPNRETDFNGSARTMLQPRTDLDVSLSVYGIYRDVLSGNPGLPANGVDIAGVGTGVAYGSIAGPWDTLRYLPSEAQRVNQGTTAKRGVLALSGNYTPRSWLMVRGAVGGDYALRTDDALGSPSPCTELLNPGGCRSGHANGRGEMFATTLDVGAEANYRLRRWLTARTAVGEQISRARFYSLNAGNGAATNLAFGTDLLSPGPVSVSGGQQLYVVGENRDESVTAGWYLEQTAAISERLYLTASVRQDAASGFRAGALPLYPKISASWVLSEEPFFPAWPAVNTLRVRTAYGQSGQQASQLELHNNYQQGAAIIDGVSVGSGIVLTSIGNPDLKPERTAEWEGGLDVSLFAEERVRFEATLYRKLSQDAIVQVALPSSYGIADVNGNVIGNLTRRDNLGSVENRGMELSLSATILQDQPLGWDLTINWTQNANILKRLSPTATGTSVTGNQGTLHRVGYPVFGYWGIPLVGWTDANRDGLLALSEVTFAPTSVFLGAPYPKRNITYLNGFTFLRGAVHANANLDYIGGLSNLLLAGPNNRIGARGSVDPSASLAQQAAAIEALRNGGYERTTTTWRLTELSVTWMITPRQARRAARARSLSVTFAGRNLARWTNYAGGDPNRDTSGAFGDATLDTGTGVPEPRNWTVRCNLGF